MAIAAANPARKTPERHAGMVILDGRTMATISVALAENTRDMLMRRLLVGDNPVVPPLEAFFPETRPAQCCRTGIDRQRPSPRRRVPIPVRDRMIAQSMGANHVCLIFVHTLLILVV
ncbi:hypothetical protein LXM94_13220 [Rhizobium sp. TRM95111]|uniref:hypothetical protein n=1 Tax=Rhizobium alarense TaxID=2846851 RepID=UPI001F2EBBB9|nr:hypothetical protein [Rhizobium alarense]MCF3640932.1 hypothetical protein [Rhizobium alarense]